MRQPQVITYYKEQDSEDDLHLLQGWEAKAFHQCFGHVSTPLPMLKGNGHITQGLFSSCKMHHQTLHVEGKLRLFNSPWQKGSFSSTAHRTEVQDELSVPKCHTSVYYALHVLIWRSLQLFTQVLSVAVSSCTKQWPLKVTHWFSSRTSDEETQAMEGAGFPYQFPQ